MERVNCSREFVDKIRSFRNQDQPVCYTRTGVGGGQAYKSITLSRVPSDWPHAFIFFPKALDESAI